jgi:hypothetical protein
MNAVRPCAAIFIGLALLALLLLAVAQARGLWV